MELGLRKTGMAVAVAAAFAAASGVAGAAGFALIEQSAGGMGNSFAGAAATAEDASTIFFNPAGLTKLDGPQVSVAAHVISLSAKFANNGSSAPPAGIATLGSNGGDAGGANFVPNAYFSMPIGERMAIGVGVNAPFGLVTEYDAGWIGRFQGIKSELMTVNINPTVAYKISDSVSVGAGVSYQKLDAELTNAVVLGLNTEGLAKLEADDDGFGWNVGVLFQASPTTRIGASYRSAIDYTLKGNLTVTAPGGAVLVNGPATADVTLPDMFSLSLVHGISDKLDLLADVTYTRWSEIKRIVVNAPVNDTLVLNFDDAYRYSLGLNYKWNERLTGKVGVAFDQSPVSNNADRTVRLPDNDRTWISVGAAYKVGSAGKLDAGYAHLFIKDAPIDQTRGSAATYGRVAGTYEGSVDILSIQYTHSF